jgi:PiT family inorganic phosphate transporter
MVSQQLWQFISTLVVAQESLPSWLDVVLPNDEGAFKMPAWIPLACYSAIAAGTLSGGWKIVKPGSKSQK